MGHILTAKKGEVNTKERNDIDKLQKICYF